MSARCKSCGASITWAKTRGGRKIPLDAKPAKRAVLSVDTITSDELIVDIVDAYTTHFETCPDAAKFRRPRS